MGEGALPILLGKMDSPRPSVRRAAIRALENLGIEGRPAVIDALLKAAGDSDAGVPHEAAEVLAKVGPSVADRVVALTKRPDVNRTYLPVALKGMDARAIAPLMEFLKSESELERQLAVEALGELHRYADGKVATALFTKLGDSSVQTETYEALSRMADKLSPEQRRSFIDHLLDQRTASDPGALHSAAQGLSQMGELATPAVAKLAADVKFATDGEFIAEALTGHGTAAIPILKKLGTVADKVTMETLVSSLRENKDTPLMANAMVDLIYERPDSVEDVRIYVGADPQIFLAPLAQRLVNPELRQITLKELGALGEKSLPVIDRILPHLADENPEIRRAAADTIFKIGKPATSALTLALNDRDDRIYAGAARVLLEHRATLDEKTKRQLLQDLRSDNDTRSELATRLLANDCRSLEGELVGLLGNPSLGLRINAIRALAGAGPAARPALERAREDARPSLARAAEASLRAVSK